MPQIRSATELKDNISKAFRDGLYSTVKESIPFKFSLDSGLSATKTNIEGLYLVNCNMHNAIKDMPVALAQIDNNGKLQIVCSDDIVTLNSYSYYNMQVPNSERRISELSNKLTQEIQKSEKPQGEYTNIDMQQKFKESIDNFVCNGIKLPSFIQSENENNTLIFYVNGKDIAGPCGYTSPDKITIGKAILIPAQDGRTYCISAVTKDASAIFDCYAAKKNPNGMEVTMQANALQYVRILDNEQKRKSEINKELTNEIEKYFGKDYAEKISISSQISEKDKGMFYKALEIDATRAINGQPTQWLSAANITIQNNTVYYSNNEIGLKRSDGGVSLTSNGLRLCDAIIKDYTNDEIATFKNEFNFNQDENNSHFSNNKSTDDIEL